MKGKREVFEGNRISSLFQDVFNDVVRVLTAAVENVYKGLAVVIIHVLWKDADVMASPLVSVSKSGPVPDVVDKVFVHVGLGSC